MYELPKKIKRREAQIDAKVAEKVVKLHHKRNWALEVKIKGNKLSQHQEAALHQVSCRRFLYKLPDMGRRNPFDYIYLGDADAIVCVVDGRNVACEVNEGEAHYQFEI